MVVNMVSPVQTALGGLQSAQLRVQKAAEGLVGITAGTSPTAPRQSAPAATLSGPLTTSPLFADSGPDLAASAVALQQAAFSYKAAAKLLAVAGGLEETLLEALK